MDQAVLLNPHFSVDLNSYENLGKHDNFSIIYLYSYSSRILMAV